MALTLVVASCQTAADASLAEDFVVLGNAYADLGRWEEATQFYRRAVEIEPTSSMARYNLARALLELDRPDEAEPLLVQLHQADPDNTVVLQALAYARFWLGRHTEALELYRRAAVLLPGDRDVLWNLALAAARAKDWETARSTLENWGMGESQLSSAYWVTLLEIYRELKDREGVKRALQHVTQAPNAGAEQHKELGDLLFEDRDWAGAIQAYIRADQGLSAQNRTDPTLRWRIGEIYLLNLSLQDQALEWFGKAIAAGFSNRQRAEALLGRSEVMNPPALREFFRERKLVP